MRSINKAAAKIMNKLCANLNQVGDAQKIDNSEGTFMPVSVEVIGTCQAGSQGKGELISVAQYGEQNGDLMRDPDICFIRCKAFDMRSRKAVPEEIVQYFPYSFRNDYLGLNSEYIYFDENMKVKATAPRPQRDLAVFCGTWMKAIKEQQGI